MAERHRSRTSRMPIARIPASAIQRLGAPEEIASIVAWLAGPDSGFSTGADFSCNGGMHMG